MEVVKSKKYQSILIWKTIKNTKQWWMANWGFIIEWP